MEITSDKALNLLRKKDVGSISIYRFGLYVKLSKYGYRVKSRIEIRGRLASRKTVSNFVNIVSYWLDPLISSVIDLLQYTMSKI